MSADCAAPAATTSSWRTCACHGQRRYSSRSRARSTGPCAQALGVAQSAVDTLVELTSTKAPPEGPALRDRPALLADIGRHSAALEAARVYLHACASQLWRTAVDGGPPAIDEITALWGAGLHAAEVAETAVDTMYAAGGISSLYTSCPLERAHRDMHAMRRHIVGQAMWFEDAGRVKLGAAPTHPLYAV
jgi:indole-3-acetate monooxygenase